MRQPMRVLGRVVMGPRGDRHTWRIVATDRDGEWMLREGLACYRTSTHTIALRRNLTRAEARQSILHEVVHVHCPDMQDEKEVEAFERSLYEALCIVEWAWG